MPKNWQSPFAELAYFIRNFCLRLTTNAFMSGIPNQSLHSLITSTVLTQYEKFVVNEDVRIDFSMETSNEVDAQW